MARALARSLITHAPTARGAVIMHPEIAPAIAAQHRQSLRREAARGRRRPARTRSRGFPGHLLGWSISWSRTILSADAAQRPGWQGSSLVIIISARRRSARCRSHSAI
jgi:hypothetical protein